MRATTVLVGLAGALTAAAPVPASRPLLDDHLLVTWYGNPRSRAMGVLGEAHGTARAEALRRQAAAYEPLTSRRILRAYHLSPLVDLVLDMDGFGSQQLKQSSYRAVMREPLQYPGIKLFYRQDTHLFTPAEVLALSPAPVVIVYQ